MHDIIVPFTILLLATLVYFFPTLCAYRGKKRNARAIFVLNLFLGWTLIGWVIALTWAAMKDC